MAEAEESFEERRERVMRRLAEMLQGDPPDLSGTEPVAAGAFPTLPVDPDTLDQESAAELLKTLQQFFEQVRNKAGAEGPEGE